METPTTQDPPKSESRNVTPGRIVRYVSQADDPAYVAIVVQVIDETKVNLGVFAPSEAACSTWGESVRIIDDVPYDRDKGENTWHWPSD